MDLVKRVEEGAKVVKDLIKRNQLGVQLSEVQVVFDTSGSMKDLYVNGNVQNIFQRLFPICVAFDDDGKMPAYEFSNSAKKVPVDVAMENLDGYVRTNLKPQYGGTQYAPAINKVVADYVASRKEPGVLSKLFGAKSSDAPKLPVYVVFITDGECSDSRESEQAIRDAVQYPIFWQFVGLKTHYSTDFEFLKKIDTMSGRKIDNANFFEISLKSFEQSSDVELYDKLLGEYPDYIKEAVNQDLID